MGSTPTFPDAVFEEQAEYLADTTPLTEREAEALLRRQHIPDSGSEDVLDRTLADRMGVSKGTFSKHLNSAREKLEGDDAALDALETLLLTTDFGGAGAVSREVIGATRTSNAFVLVSETDFYDEDEYSFAPKYRAHLVFRERAPDIEFDDLPEGVNHYTKYALFTVEADGKEGFVDSVASYIQALDALDGFDLVSTVDLLEDLGFPDTGDATNDAIQDAQEEVLHGQMD